MPSITVETRLKPTSSNAQFLREYADKSCGASRQMFVDLVAGRKVKESVYQEKFGLCSSSTRHALIQAEQILESQKSLIKLRQSELKNRIKSVKETIAEIDKQLKSKKLSATRRGFLKSKQHQKKRKLHRIECELANLNNNPRVVFGTRKRFLAQYRLEENGYTSHEEWKADWRLSRSSNILFVGNKRFPMGNQLAKCDIKAKTFTVTVPPFLVEKYGKTVVFEGVEFPQHDRYQQQLAYLHIAMEETIYGEGKNKKRGTLFPITHRIVIRDDVFYLHTHIQLPDIPTVSDIRLGVLGIDLNPNSLDWSVVDSNGNLKAHGSIPLMLQDRGAEQRKDTLGKAVVKVVGIAKQYGVPIAVEWLDFNKKKCGQDDSSKRHKRMLSNFGYAKFRSLIESRCYKEAVQIIQVNPAYTSLLGQIKYAAMYGLNSGCAAAIVIARRAKGFSERLPKSWNRAFQTTFDKPVDRSKHGWSVLAKVSGRTSVKGGRVRHRFYDALDPLTGDIRASLLSGKSRKRSSASRQRLDASSHKTRRLKTA